MYLHSLEIHGFKSFAQKTVLEFNRGVTAVVGPNGCGKSNVLDALRWVLGEQSAKALRGGEMADVIFSGTDSRPALGMAEVSLTFCDCEAELGVEWNEVRVTRRVYRDGKSEYFLNKTACRLKDIQQLFMDTGIGRSAYSIMEQGKIAQIISSRPDDRRAIFEEAAGITKFKAQKKEAMRKLEHTDANLLRVGDIIKEVRRQIGSLQRQAGKARRYQALMSDLRTFDTHWSHRRYRLLVEENKALGENLQQLEGKRLEAEDVIQEKEVVQQDLRQKLEALEGEISQAREGIQVLKNRLYAAESRITTHGERSREMQSLIARGEEEIATAEQKINDQESQIAETDRLLTDLIAVLRSGEEELQSARRGTDALRYQRVEAENQLRQIGSELGQAENELQNLQSQITSARSRSEGAEIRIDMLRSDLVASESSRNQLSEKLSEAIKTVENTEAVLISLRESLDDAQYQVDEAQKARQASDAEINATTRRLTEIESRLGVLHQLQEEGEGLEEGAQAVLKGLDNPDFFRPAIHGALATGIEAKPEWVPAIEAALGSHLHAILFKDVSVVESACLTLTAGKQGRATLLPPDWLASSSSDSQSTLPEGAMAWALDCVTLAPHAQEVGRALLKNIAIVADIETAFRLKESHRHLGFATLGGDFLSPEGWISSGKSGEGNQSLILRQTQITQLEAEAVEARQAVELAQKKRSEALARLESIQEQWTRLRDDIHHAEIATSTAKNERDLFQRQFEQTDHRFQSLEKDRLHAEAQLQESQEKLASLETQIGERIARRDDKRQAQVDTQARLDDLRNQERESESRYNEIRLRVSTEQQNRENLARQRQPMADRLTELTELIAQRRDEISDYRARIEALDLESKDLQGSIEGWKTEMGAAEEAATALTVARAQAQQEVAVLDESLRTIRKEISENQDQHGRIEVQRTKLELHIESINEHVQRRYQLDISEFQPDSYALLCALRDRKEGNESTTEKTGESDTSSDSSSDIPWSRIESLVNELTDKMDRMGPVNIDAIQEYDELEERMKFLEQQNADLINAKTELLEVISRINRTTKELFSETFEKVRVNFQEMFTELFGGGKANLLLSDENDPLESGIEIIAKPPGKQLQSISLLSGGEMTMTAVSLLFAIYMVKPSPFCVLDEMDAPLDESNINRFIKILDRFVSQSQFIVITHNKRTISRANMLYGVTMEEHGVSKLVSVQFRERKTEEHLTPSVAEAFGKTGNLRSEALAS